MYLLKVVKEVIRDLYPAFIGGILCCLCDMWIKYALYPLLQKTWEYTLLHISGYFSGYIFYNIYIFCSILLFGLLPLFLTFKKFHWFIEEKYIMENKGIC